MLDVLGKSLSVGYDFPARRHGSTQCFFETRPRFHGFATAALSVAHLSVMGFLRSFQLRRSGCCWANLKA